MQAEWGKGKKREKKEGKVEQQRDRSNFKGVLITFQFLDFESSESGRFEP